MNFPRLHALLSETTASFLQVNLIHDALFLDSCTIVCRCLAGDDDVQE